MNQLSLASALPDDLIEVWFVDFADLPEVLPAAYDEVLDETERTRRARFLFERDRRTYAVAHALVRWMLSSFQPSVPPREWSFTTNDYGRPEIAASFASDLRFNLSHTRGAALCGVARRRDLGVDLEAVDRQASCVELADRYFAPAEVADLRRHAPQRQREAFFDYWTLKEAYIKARGMGLAIPLDGFAFHLRAGEAIRLDCAAELADYGRAWTFAQWSFGERFRAATAARCAAGEMLRVMYRRVVPFVHLGEPIPVPGFAPS